MITEKLIAEDLKGFGAALAGEIDSVIPITIVRPTSFPKPYWHVPLTPSTRVLEAAQERGI
jgi:hypothetical protein